MFFFGCAGRAYHIPTHLQTAAVAPVENRTTEYGLERELREALIRELQARGGLSLAPENSADLLLRVRVTGYREEPILLDEATNRVLQYRLSLDYDWEWLDRAAGEAGFSESKKTRSLFYYTPDYTGAVTETEEEARKRLAEDFARTVWNSVWESFR